MADLISLKEFRKQIERAVLDEHAETLERSIHRLRAAEAATAAMDRDEATVPQAAEAPTVSESTLAAQEFERMKGFLVQLYEGTSCDHSFLDAAGNAIDCLPFDQQPTVKAARKKGIELKSELPPPPELDHPAEFGVNSMDSGPKPTGLVAPLRQGRVDLYGNKVATPAGTVPFRRLTLAQLAQGGSLRRHFKKAPARVHDPRPVFHRRSAHRPSAPVAGGNVPIIPATTNTPNAHRYAVFQFGPFQQSGVISGISSYLNVWNPNPAPGAMSLSQQWVLGPMTATGHPQTIESGWQIQPLFGSQCVFFIYFNPDGYSTNSGYVYNQHMEGFIAAKGANWVPGVALGQTSTLGGTQYAFLMVWQRDKDGNWNLYMGTSDSDLSGVGYFPKEYYSPGLASGADSIQFGGEVAPQSGFSPTGPMGSGIMPANAALSHFGNVAFQSHLQLQETGGTSFQDVDDSGKITIAPDPQFYNGAFGTDSSWGKYFFFGGGNAP
jgi:neprosin-like protein